MKLKESEIEHIKHTGFDTFEATDIAATISKSGAGTLHNFSRYCFAALLRAKGEEIVWPPKFVTQEEA